jgi:hypothetical protein
MKHIHYGLTAVIFVFFSGLMSGCVTPEKGSVQIENSLSHKQLEYYNDSFDQWREDLWDRTGYVSEEVQLENIKLADMVIDDGKLVIKTKADAFSTGGLASRYALSGDFDVQIDCRFDFIREILNMDQLVNFVVVDTTSHTEEINLVNIGLAKRGESLKGGIFMGHRKLGKYERVSVKGMDGFSGSLRIVRSGSEVSTFYKERGEGEWHKLGEIPFNTNDVMIGFRLSNFFVVRWGITAAKSITGTFDNFRINAAQGIIEEEI